MNIERHNAIVAGIEANPTSWDQKDWHCGTAHCYAGLAQIASGKPENKKTAAVDAMEFLDLSSLQADYAFGANRTLEDLKTLPNKFTYVDGYNQDGWDRDGYDRNGRDRFGYNRNDRFGNKMKGTAK